MSHCGVQSQLFRRVWHQTLNSVLRQQWTSQFNRSHISNENNPLKKDYWDDGIHDALAHLKCPCLMAHALLLPGVPAKRKRKRRKKRKNVSNPDISIVQTVVR